MYVATENDSVYAFDADQPGPASADQLHQSGQLITAVPATDIGCANLVLIIGITATPVIDPVTGTLYVVSKVKLSAENISNNFTRWISRPGWSGLIVRLRLRQVYRNRKGCRQGDSVL